MKRTMLASALVILALGGHTSLAAEWPDRPITLVLPAGAGGSSDPLARLLAFEMGAQMNQSVVVQNRPGAGGNMGMTQVARATPDGNTIALSWTGPLATNLALYKDVGYDPRADFAPIGMVGCTPNVLAVRRDFKADNLKQFIEYAKGQSDKLSYGTTGTGSSWHIAGEMVNRQAVIHIAHIPYQAPGAALTDLEAGRLDAIYPVVPMTVPYVKSGDIKVLAVFSDARSPVLPQVPTAAEQGWPQLVSDTCFALVAPKSVPAARIEKLNKVLNDILSAPASKAKIEQMGITLKPGEPGALTRYLDTEIPRQAELVKAAGATAQ